MIIQQAKNAALRFLAMIPHNNVFEFHHVSDHPAIDLSDRKLSTDKFFQFIDQHGPYLSLADVMSCRKLNSYSAITFDDGLEDVYSIAYPYLKKKNIPFTSFILTEKIGQPGYITREQLLEMASDPLVTFGSHGTDHTHLPQADESKQRTELIESKKQLEQMLERPCSFFAYPYGEYNEISLKIAEEAGYQNVFAVRGRPLFRWNRKNPYAVPRLSIANETYQKYRHF